MTLVPPILSVIITTHAEGILIHRTLRSVQLAVSLMPERYTCEILLHVDKATPETTEYIRINKRGILKDVKIFENSFGDLGSSRNFAIQQAEGKYIATIDADDLMSTNWLKESIAYLESHEEPTIAHSSTTVEFEGADSIIMKSGEINRDTDTLLSVFSNRWNSVVVAPRWLLLEEPYTPNTKGFGYEDWQLNCRLIARGIRNVIIPETVIFVRRKQGNSEWLRQIQNAAVLRANPLLSFSSIRTISNVFEGESQLPQNKVKKNLKQVIKKIPVVRGVAHQAKKLLTKKVRFDIPAWLENEWESMHVFERQIFPTAHLRKTLMSYDPISEDHRKAGDLYKTIVDGLLFDNYDYIFFVPWLIKGGADKFTIEYANAIAAHNSFKKVLIIATVISDSPWKNQLDTTVDFLDFGTLSQHVTPQIKSRVIEHLIENSGATHLHIINSDFGFKFVEHHKAYITGKGIKVIASSFSQSVDKDGRRYGYSHTHIPFIYDVASLITSDNQAVISMWQKDYGFDKDKMTVHRMPVNLPAAIPLTRKIQTKPLRILWAARIAPEKQPEIITEIGKRISGIATIDMFGSIEQESEETIKNLPENVSYKGSFNGFDSLPTDDYDVYLYTSLFDGVPNTLLDAGRLKLPIVASNVGGISEFVINEETGYLVDDLLNPEAYATIIKNIVKNPDVLEELSNNAYNKLSQDFSSARYKKSVEKMLHFIDY